MEWLIEKMVARPRRSAVVVLAVVVIAAGGIWWQLVRQNPQHIFEDMLTNNLTAQSVTKHYVSSDSAHSGVDQIVRQTMGGTDTARWVVTAHQDGTKVTTDSVATPGTGYIRYTLINISAAKPTTSFKSALNIWAKSDGQTDTSLEQLYSQTVLDISRAPLPPIANLPLSRRLALLTYMSSEHVFAPDYKHVKHETVGGRSVITYPVAVRLGAYVQMMQTFAHDIGDSSLDTIDPNQYAAAPPLALNMSVDVWSHQLARVEYSASNFSQTYIDWGILQPIAIPKHTITTTDLQARLQASSKP